MFQPSDPQKARPSWVFSYFDHLSRSDKGVVFFTPDPSFGESSVEAGAFPATTQEVPSPFDQVSWDGCQLDA